MASSFFLFFCELTTKLLNDSGEAQRSPLLGDFHLITFQSRNPQATAIGRTFKA